MAMADQKLGAIQLPARNSARFWIALPWLLYVVLRLPALVHLPGGQDEQWFAVPGLTVLREGIPRIPYLPTRNRETFFENADRCLMALPPALFYVQAPFFAVFPPGYPTARIPLFLAALATILVTYGVAKKLGASERSALLVATVMAFSRPLLFTGLMVRPDLLCCLCGWLCLLLLWRYFENPRTRTLVASGLLCGLAGLFHPFALVFALQVGAAICWAPATLVGKLNRLIAFGLSAAAALALWLPLIWRFPDEFRSQFFSNVVDRAGPGLPYRMLWPWQSLRHHAWLLSEFAGPWQCAFLAMSLLVGSIAVWHCKPRSFASAYIALCWSSLYLTAVVAGIHPTQGYWVYPCVWILGGLALAVDRVAVNDRVEASDSAANSKQTRPGTGGAFVCASLLCIGLMLPGGGLGTSYRYLRHWGNPDFHGQEFIAGVLEHLPKEGLYLVDLTYVFDVYLSGRETMLCQERASYWGDMELDYTALLVAWEGEDAHWPEQYDAVLDQSFGNREFPQSCFVNVYRPKKKFDE